MSALHITTGKNCFLVVLNTKYNGEMGAILITLDRKPETKYAA
jgi:hypothetical protein